MAPVSALLLFHAVNETADHLLYSFHFVTQRIEISAAQFFFFMHLIYKFESHFVIGLI